VKDEDGDLHTDSRSILNRWYNYFCQLLNVHDINDVSLAECFVEDETAIEKLKRHKSLGFEQIPAQWIQAGGNTLRSEIHKLIDSFGRRKNCHSSGRNLLFNYL
jgi:hypothetical protein